MQGENATTDNIYENVDYIGKQLERKTTDSDTTKLQSSELTGRDSKKIKKYRAATACLVLLCVLLLTAVIVLCTHMTTESKNYIDETQQLLNEITNLMEDRHQLLTNNTNLIQRNERLEELKNTLWTFTKEGWIYYKFSFYYVYKEVKNWNESRINCTQKGADLLIINSADEQDFTWKMVPSTLVWIGLTDVDIEGIWKWVDASTLTFQFWAPGQPKGGKVNNCVVSSIWWADVSCNFTAKWICEKSILPLILP